MIGSRLDIIESSEYLQKNGVYMCYESIVHFIKNGEIVADTIDKRGKYVIDKEELDKIIAHCNGMTAKEISYKYQCNLGHIYSLAVRGKIQSKLKYGRRIFKEEDVDRWLNRKRRTK